MKYLLLSIAVYLIIFVESLDISNIIYDFYYAFAEVFAPGTQPSVEVENIIHLLVTWLTFIFLVRFIVLFSWK